MSAPRIGLVAIGRNEGARLERCLLSVPPGCPVVYVDSGSTDGSVAFAQGLGMTVELLDTSRGFTAARARNAGWRRLLADHPGLDLIQFVDGDCTIETGWLDTARAALDAEPGLCAVFGRRRERFPQASLYNALCDDEWNVPVGIVEACGGDVMMRAPALVAAGGYSDDLIAGEEPDLCLRLRRRGWSIRRIDAPMTLHDADIHHARQWWLRVRRAGHAFAEHVARHGAQALPVWRKQVRSTILWGAVFPTAIALLLLLAAWRAPAAGWIALALVLLYPAQMLRMALAKWRAGAAPRFALGYGVWMVLGRFAQLGGMLRYLMRRRRGEGHRIIEYKRADGGQGA